jgi:hypothetical protein
MGKMTTDPLLLQESINQGVYNDPDKKKNIGHLLNHDGHDDNRSSIASGIHK